MRKFIVSERETKYAIEYDVINHWESDKPKTERKFGQAYPVSGGRVIASFYFKADAQEYANFKNKQLKWSFFKKLFGIE
jgi:hypothetical protein